MKTSSPLSTNGHVQLSKRYKTLIQSGDLSPVDCFWEAFRSFYIENKSTSSLSDEYCDNFSYLFPVIASGNLRSLCIKSPGCDESKSVCSLFHFTARSIENHSRMRIESPLGNSETISYQQEDHHSKEDLIRLMGIRETYESNPECEILNKLICVDKHQNNCFVSKSSGKKSDSDNGMGYSDFSIENMNHTRLSRDNNTSASFYTLVGTSSSSSSYSYGKEIPCKGFWNISIKALVDIHKKSLDQYVQSTLHQDYTRKSNREVSRQIVTTPNESKNTSTSRLCPESDSEVNLSGEFYRDDDGLWIEATELGYYDINHYVSHNPECLSRSGSHINYMIDTSDDSSFRPDLCFPKTLIQLSIFKDIHSKYFLQGIRITCLYGDNIWLSLHESQVTNSNTHDAFDHLENLLVESPSRCLDNKTSSSSIVNKPMGRKIPMYRSPAFKPSVVNTCKIFRNTNQQNSYSHMSVLPVNVSSLQQTTSCVDISENQYKRKSLECSNSDSCCEDISLHATSEAKSSPSMCFNQVRFDFNECIQDWLYEKMNNTWNVSSNCKELSLLISSVSTPTQEKNHNSRDRSRSSVPLFHYSSSSSLVKEKVSEESCYHHTNNSTTQNTTYSMSYYELGGICRSIASLVLLETISLRDTSFSWSLCHNDTNYVTQVLLKDTTLGVSLSKLYEKTCGLKGPSLLQLMSNTSGLPNFPSHSTEHVIQCVVDDMNRLSDSTVSSSLGNSRNLSNRSSNNPHFTCIDMVASSIDQLQCLLSTPGSQVYDSILNWLVIGACIKTLIQTKDHLSSVLIEKAQQLGLYSCSVVPTEVQGKNYFHPREELFLCTQGLCAELEDIHRFTSLMYSESWSEYSPMVSVNTSGGPLTTRHYQSNGDNVDDNTSGGVLFIGGTSNYDKPCKLTSDDVRFHMQTTFMPLYRLEASSTRCCTLGAWEFSYVLSKSHPKFKKYSLITNYGWNSRSGSGCYVAIIPEFSMQFTIGTSGCKPQSFSKITYEIVQHVMKKFIGLNQYRIMNSNHSRCIDNSSESIYQSDANQAHENSNASAFFEQLFTPLHHLDYYGHFPPYYRSSQNSSMDLFSFDNWDGCEQTLQDISSQNTSLLTRHSEHESMCIDNLEDRFQNPLCDMKKEMNSWWLRHCGYDSLQHLLYVSSIVSEFINTSLSCEDSSVDTNPKKQWKALFDTCTINYANCVSFHSLGNPLETSSDNLSTPSYGVSSKIISAFKMNFFSDTRELSIRVSSSASTQPKKCKKSSGAHSYKGMIPSFSKYIVYDPFKKSYRIWDQSLRRMGELVHFYSNQAESHSQSAPAIQAFQMNGVIYCQKSFTQSIHSHWNDKFEAARQKQVSDKYALEKKDPYDVFGPSWILSMCQPDRRHFISTSDRTKMITPVIPSHHDHDTYYNSTLSSSSLVNYDSKSIESTFPTKTIRACKAANIASRLGLDGSVHAHDLCYVIEYPPQESMSYYDDNQENHGLGFGNHLSVVDPIFNIKKRNSLHGTYHVPYQISLSDDASPPTSGERRWNNYTYIPCSKVLISPEKNNNNNGGVSSCVLPKNDSMYFVYVNPYNEAVFSRKDCSDDFYSFFLPSSFVDVAHYSPTHNPSAIVSNVETRIIKKVSRPHTQNTGSMGKQGARYSLDSRRGLSISINNPYRYQSYPTARPSFSIIPNSLLVHPFVSTPLDVLIDKRVSDFQGHSIDTAQQMSHIREGFRRRQLL